MVRNMGSVGFRVLSGNRGVRIQRGRRLSYVLSAVSMVDSLGCLYQRKLSCCRAFVSGIAGISAAILLRRLVQIDHSSSVAMRSVWFFLIFPTAYFLHVGYGESLFLALALGCIFAARVERWWLAGLLGAFCWMTRAAGVVLFSIFVVVAIHDYCDCLVYGRC